MACVSWLVHCALLVLLASSAVGLDNGELYLYVAVDMSHCISLLSFHMRLVVV